MLPPIAPVLSRRTVSRTLHICCINQRRRFRCIVGEAGPFSLSEGAKHVGPGEKLATIPAPVGSTVRCAYPWVPSAKPRVLRAASDKNLPPSEYRAFRRKQALFCCFAGCLLSAAPADRVGFVWRVLVTKWQVDARQSTNEWRLRRVAEVVFKCNLVRGCAMLGEYRLAFRDDHP